MSMVREIRDLMSRISRVEQQVSKLPSRISSAVGGSATNDVFEYGDTFATLPNPTAVNKFGRVTTGADKGMTCVVNEDGDGWMSFTHFM